MSTAITIGMLVKFGLIVGGLVLLLVILFIALDLMNPFRSGH